MSNYFFAEQEFECQMQSASPSGFAMCGAFFIIAHEIVTFDKAGFFKEFHHVKIGACNWWFEFAGVEIEFRLKWPEMVVRKLIEYLTIGFLKSAGKAARERKTPVIGV